MVSMGQARGRVKAKKCPGVAVARAPCSQEAMKPMRLYKPLRLPASKPKTQSLVPSHLIFNRKNMPTINTKGPAAFFIITRSCKIPNTAVFAARFISKNFRHCFVYFVKLNICHIFFTTKQRCLVSYSFSICPTGNS